MWFLLLIQHIGVDCTPTAPPYAVGHPADVCLLWFWLVVCSADLKMHQLWQQDTQGFGVAYWCGLHTDCTIKALAHSANVCFWLLVS